MVTTHSGYVQVLMRPLGKAVLQLKARTAGTWDCRGLTVDSGVILGNVNT